MRPASGPPDPYEGTGQQPPLTTTQPGFAAGPPGFDAARPAYGSGQQAPVGGAAAPSTADAEPGSRTGRAGRVFMAAGVIGVLLGVLVVAVLRLLPASTPAPPESRPSPSPEVTATASVSADRAPADVKLDDRGNSVVLSWKDRTGGRAPHYVVGGPDGASPRAMTQAEKGITEVAIDALNPDTDYCFTVIAVISVDEIAPSKEICTERA
ncbi:MAG: hypothetical protein GEU94_02395 [Micromonosporaceae bacterium]|nr:hypothetical protein [Micromonosporaceae bacterium]